jgi:hypothetical protein
MVRRAGFATILALGVLVLLVPDADAAATGPESSSAVSTFQLVCDGSLMTLRVGGGPWSAAHIQETGQTFVPVATHVTLVDPVTGEVVFEEDDYKGIPRAAPSRCEESFTTEGLLGTFVVEGTMY